MARLAAVVCGIIERRRAEGGDRGDLLSMLLQAQDDDGTRMTDKQVRDEAMTLFIALVTIARRFRLSLVEGWTVTPWPSATLRPKEGIWMEPHRR